MTHGPFKSTWTGSCRLSCSLPCHVYVSNRCAISSSQRRVHSTEEAAVDPKAKRGSIDARCINQDSAGRAASLDTSIFAAIPTAAAAAVMARSHAGELGLLRHSLSSSAGEFVANNEFSEGMARRREKLSWARRHRSHSRGSGDSHSTQRFGRGVSGGLVA